ncbi:hypothetical protein [Roseateles chitinivorans]|uniref:hypothetical protein n=1 Tax=Roseateles chitinivorans TaxID=2917965 RepID=UPI003D67FC40
MWAQAIGAPSGAAITQTGQPLRRPCAMMACISCAVPFASVGEWPPPATDSL